MEKSLGTQMFFHFLVTLLVSMTLFAACGGSPASPSGRPGGQRVFYVAPDGNDAADGSVGGPWLTFQHALGQLRAGDTLYLRGGRYNQGILEAYFAQGGTSWSNAVTIAAAPGEHAVIEAIGGDNAIRFQDGSVAYVEFRNLVIDGSTAAEQSTIVYLGGTSHHIRFRDVEIADAMGNCVLAGGRSHEFLNLNVHGCGRWAGYSSPSGLYLYTNDSVVDGGQYWNIKAFGVRFFDSTPGVFGNNNVVRNARFFNNGYGFGIDGTSDTTSGGGGIVLGDVNNVAENNEIYNSASGILVFGFNKPAHHARVSGNRVHSNAGIGIEIQSGATDSEVRNNQVFGNGVNLLDLGTRTVLANNGGS
jgi:parallel beta-helix repeat protein